MISIQPNVQANMQAHEELASLFSRNLNFNSDFQNSVAIEQPRQELALSAAPSPSQPIIYAISQHYTHSAHVTRPSAQAASSSSNVESQRPSSEPSNGDAVLLESILRNHGVDPTALTNSQRELFRTAEEPQQLRLMELWSICPPSQNQNIPALAWSSTTFEQEEHLARIRYERLQRNQGMSVETVSAVPSDATKIQTAAPESEPYMTSGYEELMRREREQQLRESRPKDSYNHFGTSVGGPTYTPATDPVYMGADYSRQQEQMEMATQYGAFQHFRGAGEMEAMDVM